VPRDALADGCERVSGELFEDIVQSMHAFLRERPGQRRVDKRRALDLGEVEEEGFAWRYRLHEDGCGTANERWHPEQITCSDISYGDLPAVTGVHVDAQQAVHHDGQSFSVCFRIHRTTGPEVDEPSTGEQ